MKTQKVPIEQLQEDYLKGPAQESIETISELLNEDKVVVVEKVEPHDKIVFRNQRDPGHPLEFHYSSKNHPLKMYKLIDGHEYILPREVIQNLEGCRVNVEKYRRNADGIPEIYVAGYKSNFVCERAR